MFLVNRHWNGGNNANPQGLRRIDIGVYAAGPRSWQEAHTPESIKDDQSLMPFNRSVLINTL